MAPHIIQSTFRGIITRKLQGGGIQCPPPHRNRVKNYDSFMQKYRYLNLHLAKYLNLKSLEKLSTTECEFWKSFKSLVKIFLKIHIILAYKHTPTHTHTQQHKTHLLSQRHHDIVMILIYLLYNLKSSQKRERFIS